jgi:hypothetical protein
MNYSHVHIVLNHFPTIGSFFGLALLFYALWKKDEELKLASFVVFMVMALLAIPTFITGAAANEAIASRPELDQAMVDAHRSAAIVASSFLWLTGTFAWLALWQYRRYKELSGWNVWVVAGLSIITLGLMMETGTHGGEISHPEIRVAGEVAEAGEGSLALALQNWAIDTTWAWPACETLHFTGLALLMGVTFLINFRLGGILDRVPFSTIHRLLPLGILGFGVTMISGMLMFNGNFPRYVVVPTFFLKMFFVVVGGISCLYVTLFDDTWTLEKGVPSELRHKVFAVVTTFCWLGALYFGRMIPFLE